MTCLAHAGFLSIFTETTAAKRCHVNNFSKKTEYLPPVQLGSLDWLVHMSFGQAESLRLRIAQMALDITYPSTIPPQHKSLAPQAIRLRRYATSSLEVLEKFSRTHFCKMIILWNSRSFPKFINLAFHHESVSHAAASGVGLRFAQYQPT